MTLSVFDIKDVDLNAYEASYKRVLDGHKLPEDSQRKTFVAIYNGSILGLASAQRDVIDIFEVLDITRGRGVGGYLLKCFANNLLQEYGNVTISQKLYAQPDFKLFSEHLGFHDAQLCKPIDRNV